LERYPKAAMAAFDELAERLEQSYQALEQLTAGSADRRAAAGRLTLSEKPGRSNVGRTAPAVPLGRAALGAIARPTAAAARRALGRLRAAGAVDVGRQWTAIVDPSLLHEIATS